MINAAIAALRFFFTVTLEKPDLVRPLRTVTKPPRRRSPEPGGVARLLQAAPSLGTTRGRVGFVATPDNRLMIYGTGGVAYGGGSRHFEVFDNLNNWDWNGNGGGSTRVGWTSAPAPNMRSPTISL